MARAKNTARAEARRRSRAALRDEHEALDAQDKPTNEPVEEARRPSLFRMPDVGGDLRALPGMFATSRKVWLPFALLLVGFVLMLGVYVGVVGEQTGLYVPFVGYLSFGVLTGLYVQFFFVPYGLFTFFIGGFVAPRASYMVGFLLGLLDGVMWSILLFLGTTVPTAVPDETAPATTDPLGNSLYVVAVAVVYGTLAAAFAAWYRDFLRRTSARSRERRAEAEAKARAKRRDERQAARRGA